MDKSEKFCYSKTMTLGSESLLSPVSDCYQITKECNERNPYMNNIAYVGKHSLTLTVSRHAHLNWELIYCTSGSGELILDTKRTLYYKEGDIAIIPPMIPHANISKEGFTNIHINLTDPLLTNREPVVISDDKSGYLLNAFNAAFFFYSGDSSMRSALLPVYGNLIVTFVSLLQPSTERNEIAREIEYNIIHNYPDSSYSLGDYLNSLPFSYDYLIKLFKKEMGVTPHKYLTDIRLRAAAACLAISQENNISEVSRLCGFKEPLYFSRLFKKKYGVSPSYYMPSHSSERTNDSDSMKIML